MKVLIIKLSSIGDVVHTLPALYALRKGFEEKGIKAEVDWLVEEAASGILKDHPLIDNLIIVKNRGWLKNAGENMRIARLLFSRRYDITLDFQGLLKSGVWVMLSGGKRRIGFSNAREMSHIFLNEKLRPYDPEKHAVERYLDLARFAGGVPGTRSVFLGQEEDVKERVVKKLQKHGITKETPFFVMVTRARWETKLWSDSKFMELAKKISEKSRLVPVLVGGENDRKEIAALRAGIGGSAVSLAGEIDLRELAALSGLSRFVISVDSGPMHIAAAAGARVIALFGPTAPWRTGPYGADHIVIRKGLDCSPCFRKKCADAKCMKEITVEDVFEAVLRVSK